MVHRKVNYTVIAILLPLLFLFTACKKEYGLVVIDVKMAHTGEPISGSFYSMQETKNGLGLSSNGSTVYKMSGSVPESGHVEILVEGMDGSRQYPISFNHSNIDVPPGNYEIVEGPSGFAGQINKTRKSEYNIRILPYMDVVIHYKNVNCYDENDSFKLKGGLNIDGSNSDIDDLYWSEPSDLQGCGEDWGGGHWLAGHIVYKWEATRGGVTDAGIDTFYVAPGVNDTIELFW